MTQLPTITTWPPETRERVAAAIIDAALPTCTYRFVMRDGACTVLPSPEPPAVGEQYIDPLSDVVLDFLVDRFSPAFSLLKVIYGIDDDDQQRAKAFPPPPDGLRTRAEAAAKLGCSFKTLDGHVGSGALGYVAIGHGKKRPRRMFTDTDLNEFIAKQTRKDVPCPPIAAGARRSGNSISGSEVIAFTAVPRPGIGAKRKR